MVEDAQSRYLDRVECGDVLEFLRELPPDCVDVSVTSPPYNKGENKKGWLVPNIKYTHSSDSMSEGDYQEWQVKVLDEVFRVTKPGGAFFYNHKIRWERGVLHHPYAWVSRSKWTLRQEIIWDRMIAANLRGWRFWQVDERIYWLQKSENGNLIGKELESRHALLTSIWRFPPERDNPHPAPFPVELPTRAIYSILGDSKEGVILDPFCGTGTTLVVAKALGHHCIGIDISREYVAFARERLAKSQAEQEKVNRETARHKVETTFTERKERGESTGKYGPQQRKTKKQKAIKLALQPTLIPPQDGDRDSKQPW